MISEQSEELLQCPAGCGRKFKKDSLMKHYKICKDVFQEKRCAFNSQLKRVGYDYFRENQQKLSKYKSPIVSNKVKTEITPYKTPQVPSKFQQVMNAKKLCKGCLREFDVKIADDHMQKCEKKKQENNPFWKAI